MATWKETYVQLAIAFDMSLNDVPEDIRYLRTALDAIVNLTTDNDGSEYGYGYEATLRLLNQMNQLYLQAIHFYIYNERRREMVRAINNFTIKHFGDLDDFVNSLDWPDLCVPFYWAELSEEGQTDTSNWIVCS